MHLFDNNKGFIHITCFGIIVFALASYFIYQTFVARSEKTREAAIANDQVGNRSLINQPGGDSTYIQQAISLVDTSIDMQIGVLNVKRTVLKAALKGLGKQDVQNFIAKFSQDMTAKNGELERFAAMLPSAGPAAGGPDHSQAVELLRSFVSGDKARVFDFLNHSEGEAHDTE